MKRLNTVLVICFLVVFCIPSIVAQNTSTQGKEFWLSFMHNGFRDHPEGGWIINQVLISAKRDCSGTVTNPLTGWSRDFTVRANNITTVEIPEEQAEVIRLRIYGDNSFAEVSEILSVPLPTVKSRFLYGLEKIRRAMKQTN